MNMPNSGRAGRGSTLSLGGGREVSRPMAYDGANDFYNRPAEREHAGAGYSEAVGINGNGYANGMPKSKSVTQAQNF